MACYSQARQVDAAVQGQAGSLQAQDGNTFLQRWWRGGGFDAILCLFMRVKKAADDTAAICAPAGPDVRPAKLAVVKHGARSILDATQSRRSVCSGNALKQSVLTAQHGLTCGPGTHDNCLRTASCAAQAACGKPGTTSYPIVTQA